MSLLDGTHYRLSREVAASTLDDDDRARFPADTRLPAGTEFVIAGDKQPWPTPESPLFYLVEIRSPGTTWKEGSRYAIPAAELEPAMRAA